MALHVVYLPSLQAPLTDAMLQGDQGILSFKQNLRRGMVADASIEVRNPGLALLGPEFPRFVAVVESPDGTLANGRVLCRASMAPVPTTVSGPTVTLALTCAPASIKSDLAVEGAKLIQSAYQTSPVAPPVIPTPAQGFLVAAFVQAAGADWNTARARAVKVYSSVQSDGDGIVFLGGIPNAVLDIVVDAVPQAAVVNRWYVLIGEAADGNPANAVLRGRGQLVWTTLLKSQNNQVRVRVNLTATGLQVVNPGYTTGGAVDLTASGLPYYDPCFGVNTEDPAGTALVARSETWHVDPATHAITREDIERSTLPVVNLGAGGDEESTSVTLRDEPPEIVRLRLVADWTVAAAGTCDIASSLNYSGGFGMTTLAAVTVEGPDQGPAPAVGWSGTDGNRVYGDFDSAEFYTGRTMRVTYRRRDWGQVLTQTPVGTLSDYKYNDGVQFNVDHDEYARMPGKSIRWRDCKWTFQYTQGRREIIDILLQTGSQNTAAFKKTLDLGVVSMQYLTGGGIEVPAWEPLKLYPVGYIVGYNGSIFRAKVDKATWLYAPVPSRGRTGWTISPQWESLGTASPLKDLWSPTFFDTDRGTAAVLHGVLRCRKAAIGALQWLAVSRTFAWDDAVGIDLRHRVRMEVQTAFGSPLQPVVGKVFQVDREWTGDGSATVRVYIGVSVADGVVRPAPKPAAPQYSVVGYTAGYYDAVESDAYLAADDVSYGLSMDPLYEPIRARALTQPSYSVLQVVRGPDADQQLGRAISGARSGRDPREVVREVKSYLRVNMRPLYQFPVIQRRGTVNCRFIKSSRGIDLKNQGGEP